MPTEVGYYVHLITTLYLLQLNIMHTSVNIFRCSVLPQFHLSEFKGVVASPPSVEVSPPCAPVDTISMGGVWPTVVETIEI